MRRTFSTERRMQSETARAEVTQELVAQLARAGEALTESVSGPIARRGQAVIPALIEILEDESLALEDAPGGGHAPVHAAAILRDLRAAEAIEPMLRVLARCHWEDILYSVLINALRSLGPPVLEPALAAHATGSEEQRPALVDVLSGIGVRDERTYEILLQALERDVVLAAGSLGEYGDPRALPHLSAKLDAHRIDEDGDVLANQEVIELVGAIKELGGTLTDDQARKIRRVQLLRDHATLVALAAELGPDDGEDEDDDRDAPGVREEILRRFEESAYAQNPSDVDWAELALRFGEDYVGVPSLSRFGAHDLREVVFELFPRMVSCEASAAPEIIRSLRAFWTFAKDELAHPHAMACLAALGDEADALLKRELEDDNNLGMAKFVSMLGHSRSFPALTEPGVREWANARNEEKTKKRLRKLKKQARRRNRR